MQIIIWPYGGNDVKLWINLHWHGIDNFFHFQMKKNGTNWEFKMNIIEPTSYKFIVDGRWCYDIMKPIYPDGFGSYNNITLRNDIGYFNSSIAKIRLGRSNRYHDFVCRDVYRVAKMDGDDCVIQYFEKLCPDIFPDDMIDRNNNQYEKGDNYTNNKYNNDTNSTNNDKIISNNKYINNEYNNDTNIANNYEDDSEYDKYINNEYDNEYNNDTNIANNYEDDSEYDKYIDASSEDEYYDDYDDYPISRSTKLCRICLEFTFLKKLNCNHKICDDCITNIAYYAESYWEKMCPYCREPL